MNVSATPMPVARANSRSAGGGADAGDAVAGQHDRVDRRADDRDRLEQLAAPTAPGCGSACGRAAARRRASPAITSSGSSMWVGPGFCAWATLNALRTTSGMMCERVQPRVPLRHRLHDRDDVDVLVRLLVHALEVALAGEGDERRAVEEGVGDRGDQVRGARAERAEADAGALGEAAVHVRHVGPALFMSNRNEVDTGVGERLVEIERLLARDPEDVLDPFDLQALHEQVRRLALHARNFSPSLVSG